MKSSNCISHLGFWILALGALTVSLSPYLSGAHWALDLFTHFQWQALIFSSLALALGGYRKHFRVVFVLAASVFLSSYHLFWQPAVKVAAADSKVDLTVTTVNVLYKNSNFTDTLTYLEATNSDVICLVETDHNWDEKINELMKSYPYKVSRPLDGPMGMHLLSRYPFYRSTSEIVQGTDSQLIDASLQTPSGEVRVLVAHPYPPLSEERARQNEAYFKRLEERARWTPDTPVLVAGDLNATPWSRNFQKLTAGADLRSTISNEPWLSTWSPMPFSPVGLTGLQIDQILASSKFSVVSTLTGPNNGSDHKPLTIALSLDQAM